MEAVAGLAFAGNILQFLQFSVDVIAKAREIYKSEQGISARSHELENETRQLTDLSETIKFAIREEFKPIHGQSMTDHKAAIQQIAGSCVDTGKQLIDLLGRLRTQSKGSLAAATKAAVKTLWNQGKISKLEETLRKLQNDLMLHLIAEIGKDLRDARVQFAAALRSQSDEMRKMMLAFLKDVKAATASKPSPIDLESLSQQLLQLQLTDRKTKLETAFLLDLDVPSLHERYNRVKVAHNKTFEWAFTNDHFLAKDPNNFSQWLKHGAGLYWVTGKPGSGKSTLMKFVAHHKQTLSALRLWSHPHRPVVASFYFWISGKPIQRSIQGLLRSLFHAIVKNEPKLISQIFPWRWNKYDAYGTCTEPWTEMEFLDAVKSFKASPAQNSRFCLFIDGLDEYEGSPSYLINFINELSSVPHIKLCVSSRSWIPFQDAWGSKPTLRLQDLTRKDIHEFVSDELTSCLKWRQLCIRWPKETHSLVLDITERSLGVFLWVHLVILSLQEGLSNGDSLKILRKRLDEIPPDLDDYFKHMLNSIPKLYREDASRLIQVATESEVPLLLLTYSYLGEAGDVTHFGEQAQIKKIGKSEIIARADETKRRLKSRCKDLLEVYVEGISQDNVNDAWNLPHDLQSQAYCVKVGFLHRSVRDFLGTSGAKLILSGQGYSPLDVSHFILQAALAEIKGLSRIIGQISRRDAFTIIYEQCLPQLQQRESQPRVSYLDELDRAASAVFHDNGMTKKHWTSIVLPGSHNFLYWVTAFGFTEILRRDLEALYHLPSRKLEEDFLCPLLTSALNCHRRGVISDTDSCLPDVEVVRMITERWAGEHRHSHPPVSSYATYLHQCSWGQRCIELEYSYTDNEGEDRTHLGEILDILKSKGIFGYQPRKRILKYAIDSEEGVSHRHKRIARLQDTQS